MPSAVGEKIVVTTFPRSGTAQVSVVTSGSLSQTWDAITEPTVVSQWFGDLSDTLIPGKEVRLDFGDGDFFIIQAISTAPPGKLDYSWRFLGTGARDTITWQLEPHTAGTRLTVTDREPSRTSAGIDEMVEGWTDFLGRLQRFMATGEVTRYDWRRDFDGSIELPVPLEQAVSLLDLQARWLPFPIVAGRRSSEEPITVYQLKNISVSALEWENPQSLRFHLQADNWAAPTCCELKFLAKGAQSAIIVHHTGWSEISTDPGFCMRERRRFSALWIDSFKKALRLFEAPVN